MPASLVAHEQPISKIFGKDYVFSIPHYQRPYSWTKDQARDLFDDLTGFMHGYTGDVIEVPPYFLGSIVLIQTDGDPPADVIDGQQRLTTLTILLSAIRANLPSSEASGLTQYIYEKENLFEQTPDRFRLNLWKHTGEFFKTYVQLEDGFTKLIRLDKELPDAQHRIRENAIYFQRCVEQLSIDERRRLATFIVR